MYSPYGFAVIDPHGDYAQNILKRIPPERMDDVVYFNAADTEFPVAFNPLEVYDEKLKTHTCSELIGVLKRLFDSWGPRLEYILRYTILALLDYPNATMLDITRLLTDKKFRNNVLQHVHDPVVLNFWNVEFASWNDKFATEAVAPVLNKVGAFTANPLVRNIIGQPKSSFNIRQIMDERKILIVNLSRGLVGEDNAALLGALIVTKIQMGAMSRADIAVEERAPFYLYVDEFQNFATDSFATILSEARKYGLNLTVANQYTAQMMQEVKDAVFGNVGSIIAFRMSADDARVMQRYFEPKFTEFDLIHMHNRHFIISMTVQGEKSQAFSGITLDIPPLAENSTEAIVARSRELYGTPLSEVEKEMQSQYITTTPEPKPKPAKKEKPVEPAAQPRPAKPEPKPKAVQPAAEPAEPTPQPPSQPKTEPSRNHYASLGRLLFRSATSQAASQPVTEQAAPASQPIEPVPSVKATEPEPMSLHGLAEEVILLHEPEPIPVVGEEKEPVTLIETKAEADEKPQASVASTETEETPAPKKRRRRRRRRRSTAKATEE